MKNLHLETNDFVRNIFVLVKRNQAWQYFFSDKSDWLLDSWPYWATGENEDYVEQGLQRLSEDKVAVDSLKAAFNRLEKKELRFVMEAHTPMLYVDFDKKMLKSRFFEQLLYQNVPPDWTGQHSDFLDEIPAAYRYWEVETSFKQKHPR